MVISIKPYYGICLLNSHFVVKYSNRAFADPTCYMTTNMHLCVNMHVITYTDTKNWHACMVQVIAMVTAVSMATTLLCEALVTTWDHLQYEEQSYTHNGFDLLNYSSL